MTSIRELLHTAGVESVGANDGHLSALDAGGRPAAGRADPDATGLVELIRSAARFGGRS